MPLIYNGIILVQSVIPHKFTSHFDGKSTGIQKSTRRNYLLLPRSNFISQSRVVLPWSLVQARLCENHANYSSFPSLRMMFRHADQICVRRIVDEVPKYVPRTVRCCDLLANHVNSTFQVDSFNR